MHNYKKFISEKVFQLSSNIKVRKALRILHIDRIAKFVYFQLFQSKEGKCSYVINGIEAQFYVNNDEDKDYIMSGAGLEHHIVSMLLKSINLGDVVYDIGASMGFHTIFFAKRTNGSGRVMALEPDLVRYNTLCANIKLNHITNVTALRLALSDTKKKGILRHTEADLRVESISALREAQDQVIDVMPGDLLIKENNFPKPNIVKIDVEGFEYFVIEGLKESLKQDSCRTVCCEVHLNQLPSGVTKEMIFDALKSFGFNKIETYPHGNTLHLLCYKVYR